MYYTIKFDLKGYYFPPQIRQIRSQSVPSRKVFSQFVWMPRCHGCQIICIQAAWRPRCCMEEELAGTAATAGLTRHYRSAWGSVTSKIIHSSVLMVENLNALVTCPQFIVGEDGTCGLVYEHAPAEGPPIVFLIDYVVKYM